jgi:hypothetical protein
MVLSNFDFGSIFSTIFFLVFDAGRHMVAWMGSRGWGGRCQIRLEWRGETTVRMKVVWILLSVRSSNRKGSNTQMDSVYFEYKHSVFVFICSISVSGYSKLKF